MRMMSQRLALATLFALLVAVVLLTLRPYSYNVTAIFHMDARTAEGNTMPAGFAVLDVPSYDGAQYYQVARNMPKIFDASRWQELRDSSPGSYAYQRFLLPLVAFVVSLGQISLMPWAFLLINIFSLVAAAAVVLRKYPTKWLSALAIGLCPSAMVAMHFTLAEPMAILLIVTVLVRYIEKKKIEWFDVLLLSLLVLTREVNILFVALFAGYSLLKLRWNDLAKMAVPALVFLGLHFLIYQIFGNVPFLMSAGARQFPGSAMMKILLGVRGYDVYTLSSVTLALGIVIPGAIYALVTIFRTRKLEILSLGALAFFCVMFLMPDYIWGSITSIGRVITPVYPLYVLLLMKRDGKLEQLLAALVLVIGLAAALGLAAIAHPFTTLG